MIIMTVDDSKAVRLTIALALKHAGHSIVEAEDGEEALQILHKEKVDLIISDFNMPGMDGGQLVRKIKADEQLRHIPVIMLTTENARHRLHEAKEAGAIGWMNKPFKAAQLVEAVKTIAVKFGLS